MLSKEVLMGKYTYLYFVKWRPEGWVNLGGQEYFDNEWTPNLRNLCKEHGVELLKDTVPYGTVEQGLYIFDTDIPLDEFQKFSQAIFAIAEESARARTAEAWRNRTQVSVS